MPKTYEALMDEKGRYIPDSLGLPAGRRVLVTVLDNYLEKLRPHTVVNEEALLSEAALAEDWTRPEEDEAWRFLNREA